MNKKNSYISPEALKRAYADPRKRKKIWYGAAILLACVILLPKIVPLFQEIPLFTEEEEAEQMQVDAVIMSQEELVNTISATGTIRAIQEIELSTEVSGKVIGLYIEESSVVEQGQLLVKVNDNDLQAEKIRLESNIEVMEQTAERQQQLFERGGATQEDYDNTLMQLNNLRAEYASVEAQIERTEVRAPFEGVVGLTFISDGAYVTPSTRIASLQDMSSVRIDFSVPERYSAQIGNGNRVDFQVQGVDSVFSGEVIATEPQIDPRTRTLQVRAVSDNSDGLLNPGSFANVDIVLTSFENAVMLPSQSLIPDSGEYKVMVYNNGAVSERFVTTGIRTRNKVQIIEGLSEGETVLVNGLLQVADGDSVQIRNFVNTIEDE